MYRYSAPKPCGAAANFANDDILWTLPAPIHGYLRTHQANRVALHCAVEIDAHAGRGYLPASHLLYVIAVRWQDDR